MELHGDAAVDDFYPIGDDFLVNSNENIRRSLDSPNWRAPRAPVTPRSRLVRKIRRILL